jgi:hypothetical protein
MKTFQELRDITEAKETAVFGFGRFNPSTIGHEAVIEKIASVAKSNPFFIYPSHTTGPKDPLKHSLKIAWMRKMFPKYKSNIIVDNNAKTAIQIAEKLYKDGYKNLIMVAGSDRVKEFDTLLQRYNDAPDKKGNQLFKFDSIKVVSAGERDPDADGVAGMSASKLRKAASDGKFDEFKKGIPDTLNDADKKKYYFAVRKGMGIRENREMGDDYDSLRDAYLTGKIWNVGEVVEANGVSGEVVRKGTNYLSFVAEDGKVHKAWLHEIELDEDASVYKKTARKNKNDVTYAFGRTKKLDGQPKERGGYWVWKLSKNYDGKVRGGIRDSWVYVDKDLSYSDAVKLMNKKLGRKEFKEEVDLDENAAYDKAKSGAPAMLTPPATPSPGKVAVHFAKSTAKAAADGVKKIFSAVKPDVGYPDESVKIGKKHYIIYKDRRDWYGYEVDKEGNQLGDSVFDPKKSELIKMLAQEGLDERNYAKEYANYGGRPEQIARRSSRNKARRAMGDKAVKGMDVGHADNNPMNNDPKNLRMEKPSDNRREPRLREEDELDEMAWYKVALAKISQLNHPKDYEKMLKQYTVDMKKPELKNKTASYIAARIANQYKGQDGRKLVQYINKLVDDGKLPKELKAEYQEEETMQTFSDLVKQINEVKQDKDVDDKDGTQPAKYYAGDMAKSTKSKRDAHFKAKKAGPAPGDADAKTKPSTHTKKFKQMYGEALPKDADQGDYIDDFEKSDAPQFRGKSKEKRKDMAIAAYLSKNEEVELDEKIEGLVKKADKSGMPYSILKKVYDRGMAAWKTGHRPGTTPQQWAMARVNSFVTKSSGTWGKADKDLAKQVEQIEEACTELNEWGEIEEESEYQGRKVTLNKPTAGDVKKSKVYVKNEKGNVVKVEFGDPDMKIKVSDPARRKSFRARHNCENPGPKWKARYWSCKAW